MDVKALARVAAIAAALLIQPTWALSSGDSGARSLDADVVADGDAYAGLTVHDPQLCLVGSDPADAMDLDHNSTSPVTMDAYLSEDDDRFQIPNPDPSLSQGQSHTFAVETTDALTDTGTYTMDTTLYVSEVDGTEVGNLTVDRQITIDVVVC